MRVYSCPTHGTKDVHPALGEHPSVIALCHAKTGTKRFLWWKWDTYCWLEIR